jgi:hypothetical protein
MYNLTIFGYDDEEFFIDVSQKILEILDLFRKSHLD